MCLTDSVLSKQTWAPTVCTELGAGTLAAGCSAPGGSTCRGAGAATPGPDSESALCLALSPLPRSPLLIAA